MRVCTYRISCNHERASPYAPPKLMKLHGYKKQPVCGSVLTKGSLSEEE